MCYVSPDVSSGAEVKYDAHPLVLHKLAEADAVVYGCGSLYTSLSISLIAGGVGEAIAGMDRRKPRILMLNGEARDRETDDLSALDVVLAVVKALNQSLPDGRRPEPVSSYVTTLLYPKGCTFEINKAELMAHGIVAYEVPSVGDKPFYDPAAVVETLNDLAKPKVYREYSTR